MSFRVTVGGVLGGQFPAYALDGSTLVEGLLAADFAVLLTKNEVVQARTVEDALAGANAPDDKVYVCEIADAEGNYRIWAAATAVGRWRMVVRRSVAGNIVDDLVETFDVVEAEVQVSGVLVVFG